MFVKVPGYFEEDTDVLLGTSRSQKNLFALDGIMDLKGNCNTIGKNWHVSFDTDGKDDEKLFQVDSYHQQPIGCTDAKEEQKKTLRHRRCLVDESEEFHDFVTVEDAKEAGASLKTSEVKRKWFDVTDILATGDLRLVKDAF